MGKEYEDLNHWSGCCRFNQTTGCTRSVEALVGDSRWCGWALQSIAFMHSKPLFFCIFLQLTTSQLIFHCCSFTVFLSSRSYEAASKATAAWCKVNVSLNWTELNETERNPTKRNDRCFAVNRDQNFVKFFLALTCDKLSYIPLDRSTISKVRKEWNYWKNLSEISVLFCGRYHFLSPTWSNGTPFCSTLS